MSDFRNEAHKKATYKLKSVPLAGMIWVATCLLVVFYIFSLIPPKTIDQLGWRGVAMENIQNTNIVRARNLVNVPPDEWPPFEEEGTLASEVYENVPTLGHLTQANFDRIMTLVTEWVAPEEGCNYCHVVLDDGGVNYVSDEIYTKVVSRRMFQMTQHINSTWGDHVQPSGVNCYTCHRGNPVPAEIWFTDPQPVEAAREGAGNNKGQNFFMRDNAYSSLPYETFTEYLTELDMGVGNIRNIPTTALPVSNVLEPDLNATERTYGLMMHISEALGTNCTFCHNSRSFIEWSVPQRVVGWYGIRSVQDINENFLIPLQPEYPAARLGPLGDAPKAHCATCHQAVNKPLNGADMISAYPELAAPGQDIDLRTAAYKFTDGAATAPATEEAAPAEEPAADAAATEEAAPAEEPAAEEAATEEAAPAEEPAAEDAAPVEATVSET
jgi:photosynthetic reaction center cytochrome c subunit